jgi:hypothetical protein
MLSTGHGRKTDEADALLVGIAGHTATRLSTAVFDEAIAVLRVLTEHRDDLVRTRTQTINRLHALLAQLIPAGLPRGLTADTAAGALRSIRLIRLRAALRRTLRQIAAEMHRRSAVSTGVSPRQQQRCLPRSPRSFQASQPWCNYLWTSASNTASQRCAISR